MDADRDPESLNVAPPSTRRIHLAAAAHTVVFAALGTGATFYALWITLNLPRFPKAALVVLLIISAKSVLMLIVGPTVLDRYPDLLTAAVLVRQRSPLVKAVFSLLTMGLSWAVVDSFGAEVSKGEVGFMLSAYVYIFAMVRLFKVNDDGGVVDSLAGATFGMMMSLPLEVHLWFRVTVAAVLGLSTLLRAGSEYLEGWWRRTVAATGRGGIG